MKRPSFAVSFLGAGAVCLVAAIAVLVGCSGGEDGILDVEQPGAKLTVRKWLFRRSLLGETGEWKLPAGAYTTVGLCLSLTDENGDRWKLLASSIGKDVRKFTIEEQKTVTIEVGAPLTVRADVQASAAGRVSFGLAITGRAGEEYGSQITKNGTPLPPPKFTIVDEAGDQIGAGQFEYG